MTQRERADKIALLGARSAREGIEKSETVAALFEAFEKGLPPYKDAHIEDKHIDKNGAGYTLPMCYT